MWRSRTNRDRKTVVCLACGTSVLRGEAREYDKEGDRWNRQGKEFEHLCKECYRELCHQPRAELESLILGIEEDTLSQEEFLKRYFDAVEERYSQTEETERER
ncbi:hypothetical protein GL213_13885 [Halogeometricum borinquense]|uniref:Small CPxCG-related zinc finger protein n=2 Tax=Halogeometricum borinquense TaxID=60847 RepID=E4NL98_HALBP|nr:hypothetical protein [Halogeometricum borinquense]ADQ68347.1 hypothetical protein Hbor_28030 [Halogeometricum borinquense DSM 11551]ELY31310.1 hypothetical protein C499_00940 [Halogeometricum borinquense DSM 11551]QIB73080.1 hypothetical protein G3I44_01555 [Halogeometricum borinquense]QIQ77520.1 hypothetical protein GL213_13885 [Halogeometricum borinquense]RYJ12769.1 hypothetical protein ELS19_01470 [Halogeometricum borinquense]